MDWFEIINSDLEKLGIELPLKKAELLLSFLNELLVWNKKFNLTAIRSIEDGIEKHLIDSLTPIKLLHGNEKILDLGSGGGLPIIPLKIYFPNLEAYSVDAVEKKIFFQRNIIRKLNLNGIKAIHSRIQTMSEEKSYQGFFDVVISRAFSSLDNFVELARPFLKNGGKLISMKGPEGQDEIEKGLEKFQQSGWNLTSIERLSLPKSKANRVLIVLEKRD